MYQTPIRPVAINGNLCWILAQADQPVGDNREINARRKMDESRMPKIRVMVAKLNSSRTSAKSEMDQVVCSPCRDLCFEFDLLDLRQTYKKPSACARIDEFL